MTMQLVVIESPLKGRPSKLLPRFLAGVAERVLREQNRHYAFAACRNEIVKEKYGDSFTYFCPQCQS